jgi:thioredoxin reductase
VKKKEQAMSTSCDVTIIGAGPYGLSVAAHLRGRGLNFRIVGSPMRSWMTMPKGMLLKSAGFASNLSAADRAFSLGEYCREHGVPYEHVDFPIPVETFCAYGLAFQQHFAPDLLNEKLVALERCAEGFELHLDSGNSFKTARVVLATGLDHFRHIPGPLEHLPHGLSSHSADHHDLQQFRGKEVAILGGGSSAIDLAVLLHEAGAYVRLVARKPALHFGEPWAGSSRTLWRRVRFPITGIGPGWKSVLYTKAPMLYRYLPDELRIRIAKNFLGPSGGWFMKQRAAAVPALFGHSLVHTQAENGRVCLRLAGPDGARRDLSVDHVIAATGYDTDLRRLGFLSGEILGRLRRIGQAPRLSAHFESSMPGLYFVGPVAAASFGPVMRFAVGADFTSRRIAKHLAQLHRPVAGAMPHQGDRLTEPS